MCVLQFLSYIPTSHRKCCAFYSILNDPWEILRYIYQPIYLYTPMACMNCFLNVLFHYHRIVQHTIILSLFHFLDCSIISLSSDVHLLSAYLVTCYFWCRFSTWRLKASFLFEASFFKGVHFPYRWQWPWKLWRQVRRWKRSWISCLRLIWWKGSTTKTSSNFWGSAPEMNLFILWWNSCSMEISKHIYWQGN